MPGTRSNRVKKILLGALETAYKARDTLIASDASDKEISEVMSRIMSLERQLSLVSGPSAAGVGLSMDTPKYKSSSRRRRRGGARRTRRVSLRKN